MLNKDPNRPNNVPSHIDLFDTGDFYESFEVKVMSDGFLIEADTIKDGEDLRVRWGNDILGLTDFSISELGKAIQPKVLSYILDSLLT